jgi:predicted membrane-bound spermidine synthase
MARDGSRREVLHASIQYGTLTVRPLQRYAALVIIPALLVFLLSGVAALLYQVVWQRMLVMFSGADVYSSTLIIAAFMAGLGLGNLTGGHLADRSSRRRNLMLFAGAELAIAAFSVVSRPLYYDLLYQRLGPYALPSAVTAVILFVSLLWPTFFMGMSLPLLARALTERIDRAASIVGALYGVNTLGAALGAVATTWWMLPQFGLDTSLRIGALLNVTCAAVVLPFVFPLPGDRPGTDEHTAPVATDAVTAPAPLAGHFTFAVWAAIYGLSGWLALSLEIVWFRLLGVMVKSTAFTFGTLLAVYLAGLGAGALVGSAFAARVRRPAVVFLGLQTAVGLAAALLLTCLVGVIDDATWFRTYFSGYEPLAVRDGVVRLRAFAASLVGAAARPESAPWDFVMLYFLLPVALIVPPTFLMGFSFPVLQRVVQTDLARLGRRVGLLLLANIAGSVVGTILTGWLLLDTLGTAGTLKMLAAFSSLFAMLGVGLLLRARRETAARRTVPVSAGAAVAGLVVLVLVLVALPDGETLWARLHGTPANQIVSGENATGVSVLRIDRGGLPPAVTVFVNGVGQSTIPYGGVHTALGMMPAFIHPNPKDVAVIGLGSGDTVFSMAGRPDIERIVAIEIIGPQLDTLTRLAARHPYGGLVGLLNDPRIDHISGDGRIFLMRTVQRFDIIEADALRPTSAYSGNLYSEEYFRLVRDRLRPNGLAATWAPTRRVHNAFVRVFPHVVGLPGMLLGSAEPIVIDERAIAARIADPRVRRHYASAGIDVEAMVAEHLATPGYIPPAFNRAALTDFNTDLFPRDEFDLSPRR